MNLLVAHGGGPTAVINSSLQGVIERARELDRHGKIYAARFGLEGILRNDLADLTDVPASAVNRLRGTPSSAIGSPAAGDWRRQICQHFWSAFNSIRSIAFCTTAATILWTPVKK